MFSLVSMLMCEVVCMWVGWGVMNDVFIGIFDFGVGGFMVVWVICV